MITSAPYLFSDGIVGILVSNSGKLIQAETALENMLPGLKTVVLVWIQPGQGRLLSLPHLRASETEKCLHASDTPQCYSVTEKLYESPSGQTHLYCSVDKAALHMCLNRLYLCTVRKVIPLEMLLWYMVTPKTICKLIWNDMVYAVAKGTHEPELLHWRQMRGDYSVKDHFSSGALLEERDVLQGGLELTANARGYPVRVPHVSALPGLPACFAVVSLVFALGGLFLHIQEQSLRAELDALQIEACRQESLQLRYKDDLEAYRDLHSSLSVWEQAALVEFRTEEMDVIMDDVLTSSVETYRFYPLESQASACIQLGAKTEKSTFIEKMEQSVDSFKGDFSLSLGDDGNRLNITSNWVNN